MKGSFGPAITPTLSYDGSRHKIVRVDNGSIMRPVRGEPTMIMSDQHCLIVFFQKIGLVIVNTVQFSTHCDQI